MDHTIPFIPRFSQTLSKSWWLILLRGLTALVFGVFIFAAPGESLAVMLLLFSVYALADGFFGIWTALGSRRHHTEWWAMLLWGVISMTMGALAIIVPEALIFGLVYYIAFWALVTGMLQIIAALRLRKDLSGEWMLFLAGLLSVAFGALVTMQPVVGLISIVWMIGIYSIAFGTLLTVLAFKVRSLKH